MEWHVRPMTTGDVASGMSLKSRSGWNQVEADWRRLLSIQPGGGFVADRGGRVVGTVIANAFGPVGWIAMMLVEEESRGQGIGRSLMLQALEFLRTAGARSIRLDATPMGRPLYESLGFGEDATILRYEGVPRSPHETSDTRPAMPEDLPAITGLDRRATATDRGRMLALLLGAGSHVSPKAGAIDGFCMTRPGSRSAQVGPCIGSTRSGPALLSAAFRGQAGSSMIVDIPEANEPARRSAEGAGLSVARRLARMTLGDPIEERLDAIWASSGPENG